MYCMKVYLFFSYDFLVEFDGGFSCFTVYLLTEHDHCYNQGRAIEHY